MMHVIHMFSQRNELEFLLKKKKNRYPKLTVNITGTSSYKE